MFREMSTCHDPAYAAPERRACRFADDLAHQPMRCTRPASLQARRGPDAVTLESAHLPATVLASLAAR